MKTPEWQSVKLDKSKGFNILLTFEPDPIDPEDHFRNDCGWTDEEYEEIQNFYFFTAKVEAYKGQVLAGESYLRACCYKDKEGALKGKLSGYLPQIIDEAVQDAFDNLEL